MLYIASFLLKFVREEFRDEGVAFVWEEFRDEGVAFVWEGFRGGGQSSSRRSSSGKVKVIRPASSGAMLPGRKKKTRSPDSFI